MVTENKGPEKRINKLIGYRKVPNTIHDRMIDNSLAHNFIVPDDENFKKKVLVKTKIFNRLLRLNNYSYKRYVQLKKKMIEFLADVENIESLDNIDHIFDKFVFPIDEEEPVRIVRDISDSFDDSHSENNDSESADSEKEDGDQICDQDEAAGAEFKVEKVDVDHQGDKCLISGHNLSDDIDIEDDKSLLLAHSQEEVDEFLLSGHNQNEDDIDIEDDKSLFLDNGHDKVDDINVQGGEFLVTQQNQGIVGSQDDKSLVSRNDVDDQVDESSGPGHKIDDHVDELSGPGHSQDIFDESLGSGHGDDQVDESLRLGLKIDDHVDEISGLGHKVDDQVDETSGLGHSQYKIDESSRPGHKVEVHDDESSLSGESQAQVDESLGAAHSQDKIDDQVDESLRPGLEIDESSRSGHKFNDQVDETVGPGHKIEVQDDESSLSDHSQLVIDDQVDESLGPDHKIEVDDDESSLSGENQTEVDKSSGPGHNQHIIDQSSKLGHKVEVDDDESLLSGHSDDEIDDQVDESSRPGHKVEVDDFIEEHSIDLDIVKHSPLVSDDQDHEKQSLTAKSDDENDDQDRISEINQDLIEESSLDSDGKLEIISKSGSEADIASQNYNSPIKTQARVSGNDIIKDHPSDKSELQDLDDDFIEEHSSESDGEKLCISRSESEHDANSQDGKNNKVMIEDDSDDDSDSPRLYLSRSESEVESNGGTSEKLETEDDVDFVGGQSLINSKEDTVQNTGHEEDDEDDGKSVTSQSRQIDNDNEEDDDSNKELALPVFNNNDNRNNHDDYDDIIDKSVILSFPDLDKDDNDFETTDHLIKSELEINDEEIQSSYRSPTSDNNDDDSQIETDDDSISKSSSSLMDENLVKKSPAKNKIHSEPGPKVINDNSRSPVIDHDNSSQSSQGRSKCQLKITSNQVVVSKYTIIKDRPKPEPDSPAASRNSSDDDEEQQVVKKSKLARAVSPERRPKKQASKEKEQDDEYDSEEELIKYMKRKRSMVKTKKKFGGKSLTSPTIEDSLKFVRKKMLPFSDYYQSTENEQGNASMVDDYDSSEYSESDYVFDKEAEASYIHYNDIDQYAESKNLQDLYLETTFAYEDLSEDDEIFMMEVPKSIIEKGNLEGQQMKLKKKYLEIGDTRYNISRVEDDEINLVLKDTHYDDTYRIENIQPIKSIIIHEPKSPAPDNDDEIDDSEEPKISFPKNLKTRNPLKLNKQPIKATSKRKIDLKNSSLKVKKKKLTS